MAGSYRGKRVLDVGLALFILFVLWPVILLIVLAVLLLQGSPILFVQARPGLNGQPFNMYKFRSMTNAAGADGKMLTAGRRVTSLGKLLRLTSLDELPELLNVLRGEMSIVGPRPLLMDYLNYYSPDQMRRHDAKPGITGWAQVNGRNNLSWEEKFSLDIWYVEHASFKLDLYIIVKTALNVVCARDINKQGLGHEGMDYFRGSPPSKPEERV